jgi:hypothetical protein
MNERLLELLENYQNRKKEVLISVASVIGGIAILIGFLQSGPDPISYARAEAAFEEWSASPQDEILYRKMKLSFRKIPALEKKYEAVIAQKLLDTDKSDEAIQIAERSLKRVKGEIPYHGEFAQTTLLIERGAHQQALEKAVGLKESMSRNFDLSSFSKDRLAGGSLLYAHNLLRIACLQQELKNHPGEKAAWEELESFLSANSAVADLVQNNFSEKKLNLSQYIAERKKQL